MFQLKDYLDNEKDGQLIMSFLTYMMSLTNRLFRNYGGKIS
jgi:hypothetical protein